MFLIKGLASIPKEAIRVYKVDHTELLALQSEASWNLSFFFLSKDGDLRMQGSIENRLGSDIIYWGDDWGFYQRASGGVVSSAGVWGEMFWGALSGGASDKTVSGSGMLRFWPGSGASWSWGASKSEKSSPLG